MHLIYGLTQLDIDAWTLGVLLAGGPKAVVYVLRECPALVRAWFR